MAKKVKFAILFGNTHKKMNTNKKNIKAKKAGKGSSILRQLTGAVIGGGLALGIYYSYEYSSPLVTAWLTVPQDQYGIEGGVAAQKNLKESEERRIAQRARYIVDKYGQEYEPPPIEKVIPANWDLDAIENMEQSADEGWGGYVDDWPEPPEEPQDGEEDAWDAIWDDAWEDDFDALSELSYNADDTEAVGGWGETWDDSYWGEEETKNSAVENPVSVAAVIPTQVDVPIPNQERREEISHVSSAPVLPSSGIGLWLALIFTLGATVSLHREKVLRFVRKIRV